MSALPRDCLLDHLEELRAFCRRKSHDRHLAEDAAQETALTALRHLSSLRDPDRLRPWLFRVAQRRLIDEVRRRRFELPLTAEPQAPAPPQPLAVDSPRAGRVLRALRRLPAFLRQPVRLHYLKGQPLREVAAILDTTVNGVKARLYRARRILREEASR